MASKRRVTQLLAVTVALFICLLPSISMVLSCPGIATNEVHIVDCEEEAKQKHAGTKTSPTTTSFKEYFKEHEVTETDSRAALQALNLEEVVRAVPAWCDDDVCSADKIHFCHSVAFINDHCCCEHRHARESLPWLPHTCYVGKERCQPHFGSCSRYREIRECCCDRLLIKEYKAKFSAATPSYSRFRMTSWILSVVMSTALAIRFS